MLSKILTTDLILLIIYFIVFFAVFHWMFFYYKREEIIKNWGNYRFKWWILPFANKINPKVDSNQNFSELLWGSIKPVFNVLSMPIKYTTQIINKVIDVIKGVIDKFRAQLAIIRNLIFKIIAKAMKKIENIMATSIFTFAKINEMTKKQLAIFQNIVYILEVSTVAMSSFTKGAFLKLIDFSEVAIWVLPIFLLGPAGLPFPLMATCFSPDTQIILEDGSFKLLEDVQIGDKLEMGDSVLSVIKTMPTERVYSYCGIIVSGSHLVYSDNKFVKVSKTTAAIPVYYNNYLINLNTNTNKIKIRDSIFSDYDEYNDIDKANTENRDILVKLNSNNPININHIECSRYKIGVSAHALINGKFISDIEFGDNNIGIVKHLVEKTDILYEYLGITMSCYQKIFYKNAWYNIFDVPNAKRVSTDNIDYLYSLITVDNIIRLDNGLVLRDFVEISSV